MATAGLPSPGRLSQLPTQGSFSLESSLSGWSERSRAGANVHPFIEDDQEVHRLVLDSLTLRRPSHAPTATAIATAMGEKQSPRTIKGLPATALRKQSQKHGDSPDPLLGGENPLTMRSVGVLKKWHDVEPLPYAPAMSPRESIQMRETLASIFTTGSAAKDRIRDQEIKRQKEIESQRQIFLTSSNSDGVRSTFSSPTSPWMPHVSKPLTADLYTQPPNPSLSVAVSHDITNYSYGNSYRHGNSYGNGNSNGMAGGSPIPTARRPHTRAALNEKLVPLSPRRPSPVNYTRADTDELSGRNGYRLDTPKGQKQKETRESTRPKTSALLSRRHKQSQVESRTSASNMNRISPRSPPYSVGARYLKGVVVDSIDESIPDNGNDPSSQLVSPRFSMSPLKQTGPPRQRNIWKSSDLLSADDMHNSSAATYYEPPPSHRSTAVPVDIMVSTQAAVESNMNGSISESVDQSSSLQLPSSDAIGKRRSSITQLIGDHEQLSADVREMEKMLRESILDPTKGNRDVNQRASKQQQNRNGNVNDNGNDNGHESVDEESPADLEIDNRNGINRNDSTEDYSNNDGNCNGNGRKVAKKVSIITPDDKPLTVGTIPFSVSPSSFSSSPLDDQKFPPPVNSASKGCMRNTLSSLSSYTESQLIQDESTAFINDSANWALNHPFGLGVPRSDEDRKVRLNQMQQSWKFKRRWLTQTKASKLNEKHNEKLRKAEETAKLYERIQQKQFKKETKLLRPEDIEQRNQLNKPTAPADVVASIHGYLSEKNLQELKDSTNYSRKELYHMFGLFKALCAIATTPNGIDKETFRKSIPLLSVEDDKFVDRVFQILDADGSGQIDWEEFIEAMSALDRSDPKVQTNFLFKVYDEDGDGVIPKSQLYEYFMNSLLSQPDAVACEVTERFVSEVFSEIKPANDDRLTREEALQWISEDPVHRDPFSIFGRSMASDGQKLRDALFKESNPDYKNEFDAFFKVNETKKTHKSGHLFRRNSTMALA
eukprot:GILJ01003100.1.p1 GENE.GILJ01003100.1~~GILJ01003100.1.p1  ORF type:complete len:1000 (+),score=168.37 GILJ01003100.1:48-3047(+)